MNHFAICSFVVALYVISLTQAKLSYVISTSTTKCPGEEEQHCSTLSQLARESSTGISNSINTTIIFLPGTHNLLSELSITNVTTLTMSTLTSNDSSSHTNTMTVECNGKGKVIIQDIKYVFISGLTFVGCGVNVSSVEHFSVENCSFSGQSDGTERGTGLEFHHVNSSILSGSLFYSNTAGKLKVSTGEYLLGGAIAILFSNVQIESCTFENNQAKDCGSAVYAWNSRVTILNTTFTNNSAAGYGGGVCNIGSTVLIENSVFHKNRVDNFGGAIYSTAMGSLMIYGSTFRNNSARMGATASVENGAAMFERSGFVDSTKMHIIGSNSSVIFRNSHFTNNTSKFRGIIVCANCSVQVENTSLFSNTVTDSVSGGILSVLDSTLMIDSSSFQNNSVGKNSSIILYYYALLELDRQAAVIKYSTFTNNTAGYGCIFHPGYTQSTIVVNNSVFYSNSATTGAAVSLIRPGHVQVNGSSFHNNTAVNGGSAILASGGTLRVEHSVFSFNMGDLGGAITGVRAVVAISKSLFTYHRAKRGSAINIQDSSLVLDNSEFHGNNASTNGGALYASRSTLISIVNTSFGFNTAVYGGALQVFAADLVAIENCTFKRNLAVEGAAVLVEYSDFSSKGVNSFEDNYGVTSLLLALQSNVTLLGCTRVSNNAGSIFAFSSHLEIRGSIEFFNNIVLVNVNSYNNHLYEEGSSITCIYSSLVVSGLCNVTNNTAGYGGAIAVVESNVQFDGETLIERNTALASGGGVYAYNSRIDFNNKTVIKGNTALENGGGIQAISSTVRVFSGAGSVVITSNSADKGGGISFEGNSKLYFMKKYPECSSRTMTTINYLRARESGCIFNPEDWIRLELTSNTARTYGGAMFVTDNDFTCDNRSITIFSECFFQSISINLIKDSSFGINTVNTYFANNTANRAGAVLYGGLMDRCILNPYSEIASKYNVRALTASIFPITLGTNVNTSEVSSLIASDAVRVCFCRDDKPDCSYQPPTVSVRKGQQFNVSAVAVDQVNNTVALASIHSTTSSQGAGLSTGQQIQTTQENCTDLLYNVVSTQDSERLLLYADGPCKDRGISQRYIQVHFLPCKCPIGFQTVASEIDCICDCNSYLDPYVTNCSSSTGLLLRGGDSWIAYINNTNNTRFLAYSHCPFDYCQPPSQAVYINLNTTNGADSQCAFNRSGKLCGSCARGLSLTLGASRCVSCSNYSLALLLPFALAGTVLVVILLMCNLSVATGTINGLILYANIVIANRSIFLSFENPNFLTVFIAWVNLDLGIETCFYDGMDSYAKTWLQLAFPLYIIALVIIIIKGCDHFHRLARLLLDKNPVATLATLILLSYTKLLRTIISIISFAYLNYSDGSHERVWLADASITYLKGKHIPLFLTAILILTLGLAYTLLLFGWQWLMYCSNHWSLRWINNTRFTSFIDAYHAPLLSKHRYWTGLLLLVRASLYLIAVLNIFGDPRVNLLAVTCTITGLILLKALGNYRYKKWPVDCLESAYLVNLLLLAGGTLYNWETKGNQTVLAYVSMSIAFLQTLATLAYHTYTYAFRRLVEWFKKLQKKHTAYNSDSDLERTLAMDNDNYENEQVQEEEIFGTYPEPNDIEEIELVLSQTGPFTDTTQSGFMINAIDGTADQWEDA